MKKTAVALILCLLLCGCANPEAPAPTPSPLPEPQGSFESVDGMFPFFYLDSAGMLYRMQKNGVISLNRQVKYKITNVEYSFVKYCKKTDTVFFASDIRDYNNEILCVLYAYNSKGLTKIAEKVILSSVDVSSAGVAVYICADNAKLYLFDNTPALIDEQVAEAVFCGDTEIIFRLSEGVSANGETQYPVYGAVVGKNAIYLANAAFLGAVDTVSERIALGFNVRSVVKRGGSVKIADCSIVSAEKALFALKGVVESEVTQKDRSIMYLRTLDETKPTLSFALYRTDGALAEKVDSAVYGGRYVSADSSVFAYEMLLDDSTAKTAVIDFYGTKLIAQNYTTDSITFDNNSKTVYLLNSGVLSSCKLTAEAQTVTISQQVDAVTVTDGGVFFWSLNETGRYYSLYHTSGTDSRLIASNALYFGENSLFAASDGSAVLYFSSDDTFVSGGNNVSRAEIGGNTRIGMWNIIQNKGIACDVNVNEAAAVVENGMINIMKSDGSVVETDSAAAVIITEEYINR